MIIDAKWCVDNLELAVEYFEEKQGDNSNLENGLNILRKYKKELDELYWQTRGLNKQFNEYYNEMINTKKELKRIQNEEKNSQDLVHQEKLVNKLTGIFQNLIGLNEKIRNKIPTISWDEEINKLNIYAQKLFDEGNYNQAVDRWNSILNIDPRNQSALEGIMNAKIKTETMKGIKKYCPSCGNPNERRLKYCTYCGARLFAIV